MKEFKDLKFSVDTELKDCFMIDNGQNWIRAQWAFTCSKLTIETLEQGVKYVQS